MKYVTHKREPEEFQELKEHLHGVAQLAEAYGSVFGAGKHAEMVGLLHDIGKYSPAAQKRQRNPEETARVDHSTAGAQVAAFEIKDLTAAFAIAGHHGGLQDMGSRASMDDGTLSARLKKQLTGELDASAWKGEIKIRRDKLQPTWSESLPKKNMGFAQALYTRMIFSCLVDADYLDTEAFMSYGNVQRGVQITLDQLKENLLTYVAPWLASSTTDLNRVRSDILRHCLCGDQMPKGLYTLTVPTGGGKTVSSLAFALTHAAAHRMKRIIYVIPYTSIIEQNAEVFRKILGEEPVLEHHSNVDLEENGSGTAHLATENWDAPVVVTTAVQFFESLFAAKTSRCRKLHNIADAVIIFDEAQMLPMPYLRPCVNAIVEFVQHYGSTALLCTATQPSLGGLIQDYSAGCDCKEIMDDPKELYRFFRRVSFKDEGKIAEKELAEHLLREGQVLCIVNSRKKAKEIFSCMDEEGRFHLSTLMTPEHRSRTIAQIRQRLKKGETCRVVSTSLIEAGVDLDFPVVWREEAGLDAILQAAGRCNREGKRSAEESLVHVFRFEGAPPRMFAQNIYAMHKARETCSDIAMPEAIEEYFKHLLFIAGDEVLDAKGIIPKSNGMNFAQIANAFHIIEEQTIPIYVPNSENKRLIEQLRTGSISREELRRLGKSAVNVYPQHFTKLRDHLYCPVGEAYGVLLDETLYDKNSGLCLEPQCGEMWFA